MTVRESINEALRAKNKLIFSSYVHNTGAGQNSVFYYVNESQIAERARIFLLDDKGLAPAGCPPLDFSILPHESLFLDTADILVVNGSPERFSGNVFMVVSAPDETPNFDISKKDLVSLWQSPEAYVQIGIAALGNFNDSRKKGPRAYVMYCPTIHETADITTKIVIFNSSTESGYNDTVSIIPRLHNLKGETIVGNPITIAPFCAGVLNIAEHFGPAGLALLAKTNQRGALTATHQGHTFSSFFFFVNKTTGALWSGRHTQPPVLTVWRQPKYNVLANWLGARLPFAGKIFPALSYLKHNPDTLATFYPHHSNYLNSWWDWFKQSRYVIYSKMMLRAGYFLIKRKFVIEEFKSVNSASQLNAHVIEHNLWNNLKLFQFSRGRIESLLYPTLAVASVNRAGQTLCIGPKNEGETLLLEAHGFKNVTGIDLFTYSPKILVMDMHAMSFADNYFDTIFCGWVLKYSYDINQAVAEIIRVARDGAIVICSFVVTLPGKENGPLGELDFLVTRLRGGVAELLGLFAPYVAHVYFWSEDIIKDRCRNCLVIFKIQKNSTAISGAIKEITARNNLAVNK